MPLFGKPKTDEIERILILFRGETLEAGLRPEFTVDSQGYIKNVDFKQLGRNIFPYPGERLDEWTRIAPSHLLLRDPHETLNLRSASEGGVTFLHSTKIYSPDALKTKTLNTIESRGTQPQHNLYLFVVGNLVNAPAYVVSGKWSGH